MTDLREQFRARFTATANDRLRRALASLHADPAVVYNELHGLAGEAGIMGFSEISSAAAAGLELARNWRTTKPTSDQQLQCARILRSLLGLVSQLQRTPEAPPPAATTPAVLRALVIEDSELIAEELADALRDAGFEAATAANLEAVLASVRAAPPSVVLVDVNLPGVEFRTLCSRIREHAQGAKLIVVSASAEDELRRYASEVGADGCVGKLTGTPNIIAYVKSLFGGGEA
jgi:CheY-like chemotaxis protein